MEKKQVKKKCKCTHKFFMKLGWKEHEVRHNFFCPKYENG